MSSRALGLAQESDAYMGLNKAITRLGFNLHISKFVYCINFHINNTEIFVHTNFLLSMLLYQYELSEHYKPQQRCIALAVLWRLGFLISIVVTHI